MTESFDPYVAWLGISDSQRPPNHYQLLGLDELEQDPQLIARSADARMANLRRVQPGERARQWQQLLDEMGLAKLCLTNPARKAQYDQQLEQQLRTRAESSVTTAVSGDFLPPTGVIARKPAAGSNAEFKPESAVITAASPKPTSPTRPIAHSAGKAPRLAETSPTLSGKSRPIVIGPSTSSDVFEQDVDSLLGEQMVSPSHIDKKSDPSLRPIIIGSAILVLGMLAAIGWAGRDRLAKLGLTSSSTGGPTASSSQVDGPSAAASNQDVDPIQQSSQHSDSEAPAQRAPDTSPNPQSNPAPTATETKPRDSQPQPAAHDGNAVQPVPEQSPADAKAVKKALADTQTALSQRNVAQARQQLKKAAGLATSPEQQADVARWNLMADYVDGFWQAVRKGMAGLRPTDDFEVGPKTVAVVEVDLKKLTLHIEGKNRSFTLADMPPALAVALAERWFDPNLPANKLYLGAFNLVDPKGDIVAARRLWQQATRQGASAEDLMPLLDQAPKRAKSADSRPVNEAALAAAPSDKDVAPARRAVKARFQRELASARSPEKKVALAATLGEAADASQDPTEQYALLREACDLAASRGELNEIEVAVSALAARFKIDSLALQIDLLKKTGDSASRDVAATIAASSLRLAEQVIEAERADLAKRLTPVVLTASKKSGDETLIEQAEQMRTRLAQVKPGSKKPS